MRSAVVAAAAAKAAALAPRGAAQSKGVSHRSCASAISMPAFGQ